MACLVLEVELVVGGGRPAIHCQLAVAHGDGAVVGDGLLFWLHAAVLVDHKPHLGCLKLSLQIEFANIAGCGGHAHARCVEIDAFQISGRKGAQYGAHNNGGLGIGYASEQIRARVPAAHVVGAHGYDAARRQGRLGKDCLNDALPGTGTSGEQEKIRVVEVDHLAQARKRVSKGPAYALAHCVQGEDKAHLAQVDVLSGPAVTQNVLRVLHDLALRLGRELVRNIGNTPAVLGIFPGSIPYFLLCSVPC